MKSRSNSFSHLTSGSHRRVIVVEDDEDLRVSIEEMLRAEGLETGIAADGAEALAMQRERPYDLVITDIYMPNKDGMETIAELQREFPSTKIIAISGGSRAIKSVDHLWMCRELGIRAFTKPFQAEELLTAVQEALAVDSRDN